MFTELHRKVHAGHLQRDAFIYVRQSSPGQVLRNSESKKRQYALRECAVALGWPIERIHTIDCDQGRTAASAEHRDGFQRLVSEVALGHAGLLLGLEVSRLARNNADWQRLLEVCVLSGCLVGDEDGIYDPAHFNDRLLLGLKGTMSEAELHVLHARLQGGMRNKARRGALEIPLPIGLVYNASKTVTLDPDPRIQAGVRAIFESFRQARSAGAVVSRFQREHLEFPRRIHRGIGKGKVIFGPLDTSRVLEVLHNPRYAGAYVYGRYGRRRAIHRPSSTGTYIELPRDEWQVLIKDAHPGYISWDEFERNEDTLRSNIAKWASRSGKSDTSSALLQGRVLCGRCGNRMRVVWIPRGDGIHYYACTNSPGQTSQACRWIRVPEIDDAIGMLLLQTATDKTLSRALSVQDELTRRLEKAEATRRQQLEQARRNAELKRGRFLNCDPDHRLVADRLEADWNEALRRLDALQQEHQRLRHADAVRLDEESRAGLLALAEDFPRVWNDPCTGAVERKRMLGLLIEDVTLVNNDPIAVHVRFRGGQTHSLTVPRPQPLPRATRVSSEAIQDLDRLLESYSDREAAKRLNTLGHRNWAGRPFTAKSVEVLRQRAGLKTRFERLRAQGFLTAREMAPELGVCIEEVYILGRKAILPRQRYGRGHRCLFAPLNGAVFVRGKGGRYRPTQPHLIPAGEHSRSRTARQR
jgi:DNA invertase Pin-like site-specific DNA recombinase